MKFTLYFLSICLFVGVLPCIAAGSLTPQALIQQVESETVLRLKRDKTLIEKDPTYINKVIDELLIPHFDFERMARWVLGKHWRKATSDQKQKFTVEFKSLLIRTYASSLQEYSDQKIKYLPFRGKLASGDVTVRSEIAQPGGFPIPVNYRLYIKGEQWLVYDISIDDISLIGNYRNSFSRQIRRSGLDTLIHKLADKNG